MDPSERPISCLLQRAVQVLLSPPRGTLHLIWNQAQGTLFVGALLFLNALGAALKGVLDSRNLDEACLCFLSGSVMINTAVCQIFWAKKRLSVRSIALQVAALAQRLEAAADELDKADLKATAKHVRFLVTVIYVPTALTAIAMVIGPVATGSLSVQVWPSPPPGPWFLVTHVLQVVCFVPAALGIASFQSSLLMLAYSHGCLSRVLASRLECAVGRARVLWAVRIHQELLDVGGTMSQELATVLFALVYGFLAVALFGSYQISSGHFDPYAFLVAPSGLVFFFCIAYIAETMSSSSVLVGEAAWRSGWPDESVTVRHLLIMVLMRVRKPAYLRAPLVGDITLEGYNSAMHTWYSSLQMMIKFHD